MEMLWQEATKLAQGLRVEQRIWRVSWMWALRVDLLKQWQPNKWSPRGSRVAWPQGQGRPEHRELRGRQGRQSLHCKVRRKVGVGRRYWECQQEKVWSMRLVGTLVREGRLEVMVLHRVY